MYQVEFKTPEGIKFINDYSRQIPKKFHSVNEFNEEEVYELLNHIKTTWAGKKHQKDVIVVKENQYSTKFIGKWKTFPIGGYGYGAIVYLLDVIRI